MNKQEILREIHKAEEHLANMKEALNKHKYERWKPEIGENYFYLLGNLKPFPFKNCGEDNDTEAIENFNCFRTKKEAEKEAEKILVRRMLEDIAKRLNGDVVIDWLNGGQLKYHILLCVGSIRQECSCVNKIQGTIYCLNKCFLDVAIQEIGEERLTKYLRGE